MRLKITVEVFEDGKRLLSKEALSKLNRIIKRLQKSNQPTDRLENLSEFIGYIENNRDYIIDYEKARREGYLISSSIMESTINAIASNRLKKNRSRKWIRAGADGISRIIVSISNNEWDTLQKKYAPLFLWTNGYILVTI